MRLFSFATTLVAFAITLAATARDDSTILVVNGIYPLAADQKWDRVIVNPGGLLITGPYTLSIFAKDGLTCNGTIEANGSIIVKGGGNVVINGKLYLDPGAHLQVLEQSCAIAGSGWIQGRSDTASIKIQSGIRLANRATIRGRVKIELYHTENEDTAAFENCGIVQADAIGTLQLGLNIVVSDGCNDTCGQPHWRVLGDSSILEFVNPAIGLQGNFSVNAGELRCTANVATTGYSRFFNGGIYTGNFTNAGPCSP